MGKGKTKEHRWRSSKNPRRHPCYGISLFWIFVLTFWWRLLIFARFLFRSLRFFFIAVGSGDRLNSDTQAHGFRSEFRVGSHELCARAGGGDSRWEMFFDVFINKDMYDSKYEISSCGLFFEGTIFLLLCGYFSVGKMVVSSIYAWENIVFLVLIDYILPKRLWVINLLRFFLLFLFSFPIPQGLFKVRY